ncbi:phospholipase D-like domain-containing protein [Anaerococcus cruorum]|uniref:phospholipase D-like domain-containing protein n=1 Tax=Anaerococcus sp. WGS1596 TaxID=3366806 RepID=UPI00372D7315
MKEKMVKIFIALLIYILIFSSLPFIKQKSVDENYKKNFDIGKFYQDDGSIAYAQVIRDNENSSIEKIRAIDNAKDKIMIGNYRLLMDQEGKKYMASLVAAAQRGVEIYIILDGNTLFMNAFKNNYYLALESFPNVHIKLYNPMNPLKPWSLMGRMHDKYMIVDEKIGFVGGRNIEKRFLQNKGKISYDWDILVYFEKRSQKDGLGELIAYFKNIYQNGQRNKDVKDAAIFTSSRKSRELISELEKIYRNDKSLNPDNYKQVDYKKTCTKVGKVSLITNPIDVYSKQPLAFYQISELMKNSKSKVSIHTPYFIGNELMFESLKTIASNNPTTLFTNSPATGVNLVGVGEYLIHYHKLIDTKANILENEKPHSYHGKAFTIDDNLAAVGSFNWDMRSVYIDTELMLVVEGEDFYKEVEKELNYYQKDASKVLEDGSKENLSGKEVSKINFLKKLGSIIFIILFYPFRFLF